MARVEFFYDYGSPYSYLADCGLEGLVSRSGVEVVYRPMLLGGVFKATGNQSPFVEPIEAKRRYFSTELRRWVAHLGFPFEANPHFPINTLGLMRAAHAAQATGVFKEFHRTIYDAFWIQGAALGEPEVMQQVLDRAGLDGAGLRRMTGEAAIKQSLLETTNEAAERGVFGAPSFFVGDEMFFGNDRMEFVERAIRSSST